MYIICICMRIFHGSNIRRGIGRKEHLKEGILERRNIGRKDYWKEGILEGLNIGKQERRNIGRKEYFKEGILEGSNVRRGIGRKEYLKEGMNKIDERAFHKPDHNQKFAKKKGAQAPQDPRTMFSVGQWTGQFKGLCGLLCFCVSVFFSRLSCTRLIQSFNSIV